MMWAAGAGLTTLEHDPVGFVGIMLMIMCN